MRFMILVKADAAYEAGAMPSEELLINMGAFNKELVDAGIMLDGGGLHPSSRAARVAFTATGPEATPGPFADIGGLISGYWFWQVDSMEQALDWLKRAPFPAGAQAELRRIFSPDDYGPAFTPELQANERELRDRLKLS